LTKPAFFTGALHRSYKQSGQRRESWLGSRRSGIALQFFTETLLVTTAAVVIAMPMFNMFSDLIPKGVYFCLNGATLLFLLLVNTVTTLLRVLPGNNASHSGFSGDEGSKSQSIKSLRTE
jgi:hypothetical protein